jgi:hypothetical protein
VGYLINGGNVFTLQKILGHESLEMIRKYVYLASGDVKEKHRRFSPMDNWTSARNGAVASRAAARPEKSKTLA